MVSGLLNDKMWACKMKDCLRYSLIYMLPIAFNFTVHLKITV